jgi:RHS repeat-associated protein
VNYLFQGERIDAATGLYHMDWRDYSASLGRWLNPDPSGFPAGDTNLYRSFADNPSANGDPTGLQREPYGTPYSSAPSKPQPPNTAPPPDWWFGFSGPNKYRIVGNAPQLPRIPPNFPITDTGERGLGGPSSNPPSWFDRFMSNDVYSACREGGNNELGSLFFTGFFNLGRTLGMG